jgi:hypothetical protein
VALRAALQTGYRPRTADASLATVLRELQGREPAFDAGGQRASLVPRESSLFPLDAFGEPDPEAPKPPPPEGLILFRF